MVVMLATLALNEMEWLPLLYSQHKDWPGMLKWVFVESADKIYAETNPKMVTSQGLSVDGTTEYLAELAKQDPRIVHVPYGFSTHKDPAQGKCDSRKQYLIESETIKPDFIYVVDADEFYPVDAQQQIYDLMHAAPGSWTAFCFGQRHIWRPPSIANRHLFQYEVTGGFWDIPHCRGWRWFTDMEYRTNHNTPEVNGLMLDRKMARYDKDSSKPRCVHLGFASSPAARIAKNHYYAARGEGRTDHRGWYVESRAMFETWQPGDELPRGAVVREYDGVIPEAFLTANEVKKPVSSPQFWRQRLTEVHRHERDLHKSIYDIDLHLWQQIQEHCRRELEALPVGSKLLDAGCGYGSLYEVCPKTVKYTGVDNSDELVQLARQRNPEGMFYLMNLKSLDRFVDRQFDITYCRSVKRMIIDNLGEREWEEVNAELHRVSKTVIYVEYEDIPVVEPEVAVPEKI